jgi:hypothetical protein
VVEILTIHTDKDFYVSGEVIQFKINGYNGLSNNADNISDIIYVELLNGENDIVSQQRLHSEKLSANGEFTMPPEVESGYYTIQAYTSWNRNFGTSVIACKRIRVINPFNLRVLTNIQDEFIRRPYYQITLHPEYLNILKNVTNRIIIRSLNKFLQPVPGTGIVFNSMYDTLNIFNIDSSGLGSINLAPVGDMKYFIQFLTAEKDTIFLEVPPAVEGLVINTNTTGDYTDLSFISTAAFSYPYKLNLLITKGINIEYFAEDFDLKGESLRFASGTKGPGIYTVYILTDSLEIIARKNFFISPVMEELKIRTDKDIYSTRERITAIIDNPGRDPAHYTYEISVIKDYDINRFSLLNFWEDYLNIWPDMPAGNACSELIQDIVIISEPSLPVNELFSLYNSRFSKPPEYKGEILSGQVLRRYDNAPVPNQIICLTFNGASVQFYNTRTDSSGRFFFYMRDPGNAGYMTLTCYPQDQYKIIHIDDQYLGNIRADTLPPLMVSRDAKEELEEMMLSVQVRNIYGQYIREAGSEQILNEQNFYGKADFNLDMAKFVQLPVMEEVFFEIVKEVMVDKTRTGTNLWVIDENLSHVIGNSPLILVDGVPYFDTRYLLSLEPKEVKKISVVHYKYYLGNMVFDGIIDVRTKQGNIGYNDLPAGSVHKLYEPAGRSHKGNNPDYSVQSLKEGRIPDYRTVLYWNPNFRGENEIRFYSSDLPGRYKIIIKEIRDGKVTGYGNKEIQIK